MMNLIQVAERLKDMKLEVVMAYANGMNPEVPPYVALSELQRRKRAGQMAQPAQAPTGTVKDQLEQQVGLMALQKQQMAAQPQPQMAQGIPTASVPEQMFSAAEGGIVAFARAGQAKADEEGEEGEEEEGDAGAEEAVAKVDGEGLDAAAEAKKLLGVGMGRLQQTVPPGQTPLAQRAALIKQYPHLAVLNQPIGQEAISGLQALQAKQAQEDARQRAALQDQRKMEFFKSLIAAGEATRGQKGLGALFGGFGRAMAGAEEQLGKQETEIRGRGLKREADVLALRNEIAKLERARAEGDVQSEIKHAQAVAEMANKLGISQNALARGMFSGLASLAGRQRAAEATEEAARIRARAMANKPEKVTDYKDRFDSIYKMLKKQNPEMDDDILKGMAAERAAIGAAAATTQGRSYRDARDALRKAKLNLDAWDAYKKKFPTESDADDAFLENYMSGAMPPMMQPGGGKPINLDNVPSKR